MEERMACLWTVEKFARWKYDTDAPTKAQRNMVTRMCQQGRLPAVKVGREWRIDVRKILEGVGR